MSTDARVEQTAVENVGRIAARGLVFAGGVFWVVAAFSGPYVFHDVTLAESLQTALWPFLATVLTLVISWRNERLAALLLFGASAALAVWGVLYEWEVGVWILMAFVLFAPPLIAAVLFLVAARAESHRNQGTKKEQATEPPAASGSRKVALRTWIVSAVFGILAFACAVPVYFTATPKQCASCHSMEEYYESWQSSSHQEAAPTCVYCHVEPGFINLARYEVEFYGEIVAHFAGAEPEMSGVSTPGSESCQRDECHSLGAESYDSDEVVVAHVTHVETEGIGCPKCHPGAVHEGVAGRSMIPPMEQCSECHEDEMGNCDYCHSAEELQDAPETH